MTDSILSPKATTSPNNIFILAGQSNMAGRGGVSLDPTTDKMVWDGYIPLECESNDSIFRLNADMVWEQAHEPLHWDIDVVKTNGIGPGMAFANELLAIGGKRIGAIGLVPCAIGGSHLKEWVKGTNRYDNLVERIRASEKNGGTVQGILWYQGESDAAVEEEAMCYERELTKFFIDLRADTNHPELPIILVKLVTHDFFLSPNISFKEEVCNALEAVTHRLPNVTMVDGPMAVGNFDDGLNEDKGHLNVKSEVKLGKMFAHSFYSNFAHNFLS
ncbi:probable carbohydrate esterase At4g34215 [Cucumis sativus]|uniref:Sialate O-acetylesterase domain-containing protein n=1 Tax=Cucumis sativus TaxID=3659 RepID=A0A0A0K9J9_CUCSA|nr:probable carbohydrate esterase At4g34215 [Cucumis sativus]XP_031745437.1 probable carbohydrate esterase At4g34215 [Cucumis sativus]KGN46153.1 hypothetical protein Csa_004972 [Cucumis sativus]